MQKKVIAVLFGGVSSEHDVSKRSAETVIPAIPADRYTCLPIYISKEGKWFLYEGVLHHFQNIQWERYGTPVLLSPDRSAHGLLRLTSDKVKTMHIDAVLPLIHGKNGEDGTIQGLCDVAGIPCAGSGVVASAVCMDKALTRLIAKDAKVPQTTFLSFLHTEPLEDIVKKVRYKIGYPCFVKPANGGSSIGISKATNKKELEAALTTAFEFDRKVLVEKAIVGRELEVAILGNHELVVSEPGEVVAANDFYDYEAKYHNALSKTDIAPELPEGVRDVVCAYAEKIYRACGASGFARVDFFLENETNRVLFNEINTIPGFNAISMYPKLMEASGVPLSELCDRILSLAFEQ